MADPDRTSRFNDQVLALAKAFALAGARDEAVAADQVVDVYQLAGVETPEISIRSDEFLDLLAEKEKPNLQMGLLRRLLNDQIRTVQRKNIVQGRKFSEMLDEAVNRYTNRSLSTAEIVAELVKLAKEMRDAQKRHEELGAARGRGRVLRRRRAERRCGLGAR